MKKLLGIVVLGLLLSGNAYAEVIKYNCTGANYDYVKWEIDFSTNTFSEEAAAGGKKWDKSYSKIISYDQNSLISEFKHKNKIYRNKFNYATNQTFESITTGNIANFNCNFDRAKLNNFLKSKFGNSSSSSNTDISFNIKQKKEQCEVIGFKPETEKFADCVLRLVELDVKKQQSNKIAQAQQSGNDALVKQLQRQQYDRGTDALLNLGQQLLKPKQYNSNIYKPQTQRCTIQGFGTFANMICR